MSPLILAGLLASCVLADEKFLSNENSANTARDIATNPFLNGKHKEKPSQFPSNPFLSGGINIPLVSSNEQSSQDVTVVNVVIPEKIDLSKNPFFDGSVQVGLLPSGKLNTTVIDLPTRVQEPSVDATPPKPVVHPVRPVVPPPLMQPATNFIILFNINRYPDVCGINIDFQPLVLSGQSTRDGEYPWLVALFVYSESKYNFKCAGNLITDRHVLTAAHCLKDLKGTLTEKNDLLVVLGSHSIKNWARHGIARGVSRSAVHWDYTKPADGDIALLTLDEPVTFGLTIKPICLWEESDALENVVGATGVVAGWGRDEQENTFLTEPRQVAMPIVSQEDCLRSDERFFKITSTRSFCAGERKGSTPCTGDSGGGFIIKRNHKWTLRGIVSVGLLKQGTDVCDGAQYTVFSDVSKYRQWIVEQMEIR